MIKIFQVRVIGTDYALSMMCGVNVAECTMSRWFTFMGTYNAEIGAPLSINFITDDSETLNSYHNSNKSLIIPPTTRVYQCSEAAHPGGSPCSCQDCTASCISESPFPAIAQVFFTIRFVLC